MHLMCARCYIQDTLGTAPKGALQDLYKGAQKGAPEIALKVAFQDALELHLFMQLLMRKSAQYHLLR